MTILGLECSAKAASAAVTKDGELLCETFTCVPLTHSQTLLPMAESMLKNANLTLSAIDCLAVAAGPGSFTGLRIGIAGGQGTCYGVRNSLLCGVYLGGNGIRAYRSGWDNSSGNGRSMRTSICCGV